MEEHRFVTFENVYVHDDIRYRGQTCRGVKVRGWLGFSIAKHQCVKSANGESESGNGH